MYLKHSRFYASGNQGEPDKAGEPGKPGKPGEPGKPGKPLEPGKPGEPIKPCEPGKPGEPGELYKSGKPLKNVVWCTRMSTNHADPEQKQFNSVYMCFLVL